MLITEKEKLIPFYTCHRVWQGIPGIVRTKGGRTFVSLYSGATTEAYGNYVVLLKSETNSDFGEPIAVVKKEGNARCFDPVVWIDPLDRLWLIWSVMPGEAVYGCICDDPDARELVWGKEFYIGRGIMMNKPTVLTTGEWLFPIAVWKTEILPEMRQIEQLTHEETGSYVYKTSDNGKSFVCLGKSDVRRRFCDEHMVIELNNGVLMMLVRILYGISVSFSYDRGKTWSRGEESRLGGPCSRFYIGRLRSGRILLINHVNFTDRNNLTALLSEDDGKTFPYQLLLDGRDEVSYPDAMEAQDGYIYITYDRERGVNKESLPEAYACAREILTARITEEDILKGSLMNPGSFLQNVVCKLSRLDPGDPDPYQETIADTEAFVDSLLAEGGDILGKIFTRYPVDCIAAAKLDMAKLDSVIEQFYKSGSQDRTLLLRIIDLIRPALRPERESHPFIERIHARMESDLMYNTPISEIAADMNISVYYLSHLFKSVTGITPVEYRNTLRLTKAKQMLIGTDETISEIANKCGFGSASYFAEMFTRSEKIPPTEYRKYHAPK